MNHASSVCLLTGSEFDEFGKVSFETDHGKFAERSADSVIADMTLAKAGCFLACWRRCHLKDKVHCFVRIFHDTFRFEGLQRFLSSNAGLIDDWQLHHLTNNTMRDRRLKFGLLIVTSDNMCYFILLLFLFFLGTLPSKLLIVELIIQQKSRRSKWLIAQTGLSL